MQIYEIFKSIDNDGTRVGYPTTFIRTFSCNLNCSYCDAPYCVNPVSDEDLVGFTVKSVEEIMEEVVQHGNNHVEVIGGEPLLQRDCPELVAALLDAGYLVSVETQGACSLADFESRMLDILEDDETINNLVYVLNYKCPNSGMTNKMLSENLNFLIENDCVKFIVSRQEDINYVKSIIEEYEPIAELFAIPLNMDAVSLVDSIYAANLRRLRVQLDLHKEIYGFAM